MKNYQNRVAIVTGAARNIGKEIATKLSSNGINVVINAIKDTEAAEGVAKEINDSGGNAIVHMADVTNQVAVNKMIEQTLNTFGRLDILISNASIRRQIPITQMSLKEWHDVLAVPLDGAFLCAKASIPHMKVAGSGRIVTLGGISAYIGTSERVHLLTAKAGLVGLTRGLAVELAPFNITCNVVSPGHIDTKRPTSAGIRPPMKNQPPIKRLGKPTEIASMVNYLCSNDAAYITGQTLHVNGGMYLGS